MNIIIKLSTGKEMELTELEAKELFVLFPTITKPWFEPIQVYPVYPAYPNYHLITYKTTC